MTHLRVPLLERSAQLIDFGSREERASGLSGFHWRPLGTPVKNGQLEDLFLESMRNFRIYMILTLLDSLRKNQKESMIEAMEQKQQPPYPLRMPAELRIRLEKQAELQRRSLNAEISDRLERSFEARQPQDGAVKALTVSLAEAQHDRATVLLERETFLINLGIVCHMLDAALARLKVAGAEGAVDLDEVAEFQGIRERARAELAHRAPVEPKELVDAVIASRRQLHSAQDALTPDAAIESLRKAQTKLQALSERRQSASSVQTKRTKSKQKSG